MTLSQLSLLHGTENYVKNNKTSRSIKNKDHSSALANLILYLPQLSRVWLTHRLMMVAVNSSETSANIYHTTQHNIPEDSLSSNLI
jgi:hypothetical protein